MREAQKSGHQKAKFSVLPVSYRIRKHVALLPRGGDLRSANCKALVSVVDDTKQHGQHARRCSDSGPVSGPGSATSVLRQCRRQPGAQSGRRRVKSPTIRLPCPPPVDVDQTNSITKYLTSTNVQLGASYPIGQASTRLVEQGSRAVATYINADPAEVVLGPSTTQLFRNLSASLCDHITADSEIIVCKLDHEANIVSWVHLAREKKCTLKWIEEPRGTTNPQIRPAALRQLMSPRTKLVACTHTSNVLGTINDIAALAEVVHEVPGALFCVDGVAFAPHRAVDVRAWGIDIYAFSW